MKKAFLLVFSLAVSALVYAAAPAGYYSSCEGYSGQTLLAKLYDVIKGHTVVSYAGLWGMFNNADIDADGKIIDMYSTKRWTPETEQCGNISTNIGSCYNREHSFPKSWFGGDVSPMYTDAFQLYPTDGVVNGQRDNYPFGECANGVSKPDYNGWSALGRLGTSTFPGYTGMVFEPDDEYKGDFARTYFYMATRYYNLISGWDSPMLDDGSQFPAFTTWALNLLLKWHRQDPVSDKELARQEVVYGYQHNRNPYIDHPELVEYIYGDMVGTDWTEGFVPQPAINRPVDGTTFDCGNVLVGSTSTTYIPVLGTNLTQAVTATLDTVEDDTPAAPYVFDWTNPESLTPAYQKNSGTDSSLLADVVGVTFTSGPVSVDFEKTVSSATPSRLWQNKGVVDLRVYANNTSTFSVPAGKKIVSIEITSPNAGIYGAISNMEYPDGGTGSLSEDCKTWVGSAQTITVTWAKSSTTVGGGLGTTRFNTFTVYVEDSGPAQAQPRKAAALAVGDTYELVTNIRDINIEGTYLLVGYQVSNGKYYVMGDSIASKNYFDAQEISVADNTITISETNQNLGQPFTLETASTGYNVKFLDGSYLQCTDLANTVNMVKSSTPTAIVFAASKTENCWSMTLQGNGDANRFMFNSGSPRFTNYKASVNDCMLFRKVVAPEGITLSCFTVNPETISAAEAMSETQLQVDFTPTEIGEFRVALTLQSGAASSTVYLKGVGYQQLAALPATKISDEGFTANWVDVDEGEATYQLYVCDAEGTVLEGYPVSVNSGAGGYNVADLESNTIYGYYLKKGDFTTETISVTTLSPTPVIIVSVDGGTNVLDNDGVTCNVRLQALESNLSPAVSVKIYTNITEEMEVSIDAPFEVSLDNNLWSQDVAFNPNQADHVFLRLNGSNTPGHYTLPLLVKAFFVPDVAFSARRARSGGTWQLVNDDFLAYGQLGSNYIPTSLDTAGSALSPWEAYSTEPETLTVENNSAEPLTLAVYTIDGHEVASLQAPAGLSSHRLPTGFYLIVAADTARRLTVK